MWRLSSVATTGAGISDWLVASNIKIDLSSSVHFSRMTNSKQKNNAPNYDGAAIYQSIVLVEYSFATADN